MLIMKEKIQSLLKSKVTIPAILLAVTLCIVVVIFIFIINKTPSTQINNLSSFDKSIPSDIKENIYTSLYNLIKTNNIDNPPSDGAMVRGNTFATTEDEEGTTYTSFIVDLEKLQQSYFVQYEYNKNKNFFSTSNPVVVSCIYDESQIIYKDFHCKDEFTYNPENDDVYWYIATQIPYSLQLDPENYITITSGNSESELNLRIDKCDPAGTYQSIEKVKSWINLLGVDPELFTFNTYCNPDKVTDN